MPGDEYLVSELLEDYKIEPETIFEDLSQRNTDLFTLRPTTLAGITETQSLSKSWGQAEFLKVAEAFHEYIWQEPVKSWNLNYISFDVKCANINQGFDNGGFRFFKIAQMQKDEARFVHDFSISPSKNSVLSLRKEFNPKRDEWTSINFGDVTISAEAALAIAEKNGGSQIRSGIANNCVISISITPTSGDDVWHVYYLNGIKTYFEINIDNATGKVKP